MADNSGGANSPMGMVVGALLMGVIAVVAFLAFGGGDLAGGGKGHEAKVSAQKTPKAP